MTASSKKVLSNSETVLVAVYLLRGDSNSVDTEDVAVKANELAPGAFTWRKYREQINLEIVRVVLYNLKKPENGGYLIGAGKDGWLLTEQGLCFAKERVKNLGKADPSRKSLSMKERNWLRRERERMLSSDAFVKFSSGQFDTISHQETESFFRVDAYVTGNARAEKILRSKNMFGDDPELGELIRLLETKINQGEQK